MPTNTSDTDIDLDQIIVERRQVLAGCADLVASVRELRVSSHALAKQVHQHEQEGLLKILRLEADNKQLGYDIKARDRNIDSLRDTERRLREQLADWKATAVVHEDRIYELEGMVRSLELDLSKATQRRQNEEQARAQEH